MPRRVEPDDDWDEDGEEWGEDEGDEPTRPCPHCRRDIYEDAERCPHCEHYLSEEDSPPSRKPVWFVVGALLGLYAVYRWIVG